MGGINLVDTCEESELPDRGTGTEIIIPAWNDIIHLAAPPSYSSYELATIKDVWTHYDIGGMSVYDIANYMDMSDARVRDYIAKYKELRQYEEKKKQAAIDLSKSPSPTIAQNFGIIMTAIDDMQDFTTTVGVLSRILGRVFKPAELLAIGAFTIGEFLNRLNLWNRLTGGEKAVICKLVKELKKSSGRTTIKADVDRRMRRLWPSKGEAIEMLQTTDQLFGVGISLGPIVGLIEDAFFGVLTGAPVRFKEWTISDREKAVLRNIVDRIRNPEKGFEAAFKDIWKFAESASNVIIGGQHLEWNEFATGLAATVQTGVSMRCTAVKEAAIGIWEVLTGQKATTKKKTRIETKILMQSLGSDPYTLSSWPVPGLGRVASIQDIMEAYSIQSQKVLNFWRNKLGVSDEGLFLDACVKEIGTHAAAMFCAPDGVITESLDTSTLIYLAALDYGLNPPSGITDEKFREWHDWILSRCQYFSISSPPVQILKEAFQKFFGS